jgi:chemotaxis protein MotB
MKPEGRIEPEIIIKRVKDKHAGGHHGGAWKIAYADFVTAMMAFFMLLWIIGATNDDQRKGIADYFTPTVIQMKNSGGSNGIMGGRSIQMEDGAAPRATAAGSRPVASSGGTVGDTATASTRASSIARRRAADDTRFRMVEKIIAARLAGDPTLKGLKGQLRLVRTDEGLRIELIERADFAMFGSGTSDLGPEAEALVRTVAAAIATTPNQLTVRGHTDSIGYARGGGSNWTLSSARADSTRRALVDAGIAESRFRRIEGVADTDPYNPQDRSDPRNRRISITVLNAAAG